MSLPAESAASSPNKSPAKRHMMASPELIGHISSRRDRDQNVHFNGSSMPFSSPSLNQEHETPASDIVPMKSIDDSPGTRYTTPTSKNGTKWAIPAIRTDAGPLHISNIGHVVPTNSLSKVAGVVRFPRQEAWLKFMALEGATQICLEALMEGSGAADNATGLLSCGSTELKRYLGLNGLLLEPNGTSEATIYWDDREEATDMEFVIASELSNGIEPKEVDESITIAPRKKSNVHTTGLPEIECDGNPRVNYDVDSNSNLQNGDIISKTYLDNEKTLESNSPCVEASVIRVVGNSLLDTPGGKACALASNPDAFDQEPKKELEVELRPADLSSNLGARSSILRNGAINRSMPLRITTDIHHGTIMVALIYNGEHIAAGTVQISELARAAVQADLLSQENTRLTTGFLRGLVPGFGRRNERGSSMVWVRLVDAEGEDAGDAILAAKVVPAETTLSPSLQTTPYLHPGAQLFNRKMETSQANEVSFFHQKSEFPSETVAAVSKSGFRSAPLGSENRDIAKRDALAYDSDGNLVDHGQSLTKFEAPENTRELVKVAAMPVLRVDNTGITPNRRRKEPKSCLHATTHHVYDTLLEAALVACNCSSTNLTLKGPWAWLVERYAEKYSVKKEYARLSFLNFVLQPSIAVPTSLCLETIVSQLKTLLEKRDSAHLNPAELAILQHILERVNALLANCFENYFALNEEKPGGMNEMLSMREKGVPAALTPASTLLCMTRDMEPGPEGGMSWLVSRLRMASRKRFHALLAATEARRGPSDTKRALEVLSYGRGRDDTSESGTVDHKTHSRLKDNKTGKKILGNSGAASSAYGRMEELCACIISELEADENIHNSNVMVPGIRISDVTSVEYIRGTMHHLQRILQKYPPSEPSGMAIQLVEAVVSLQKFIENNQYNDAANRLNAKDIFGEFVSEWISRSSSSLRRQLRALNKNGPPALGTWLDMQASGIKFMVAPIVDSMISCVDFELHRYERIVVNWPVYAPNIETALVQILRGTMLAVSNQCGLTQTKENILESESEAQPFGRVAWRWIRVENDKNINQSQVNTNESKGADTSEAVDIPTALRQGLTPYQALLLNSLRRMLASIPQLEQLLKSWYITGVSELERRKNKQQSIIEDMSELGAHWAQLVKELRTRYVACIRLSVEAITSELSMANQTSIQNVLRRDGPSASQNSFTKRLRRALESTVPVLRWLAACLDERVFVALSRGMWDLTARDILQYAEGLAEASSLAGHGFDSESRQENRKGGAWRARKNAQIAIKGLESFYRNELAAIIGSNLQDRDLTSPQHAQRAHALLADNSEDINVSFDVY